MFRPSRSRKRREFLVQKPRGMVNHRVQAVGPEHFGVVSVDCAKARSKFFFCDFYGRVLIEPTEVEHTQPQLRAAIAAIRDVSQRHAVLDCIVAIERTGTYHRRVQDAFRQANFETRLVHPLTSKHYRQPADPGNKTDDTDLAAIFRAAVNGFGLLEPLWPEEYQQLQWLIRQRRDLVCKSSLLRCQVHELLHTLMPGYITLFKDHFFDSPIALTLARQTGSAPALLHLGLDGLQQLVPPRSCRLTTLHHILDWARSAPIEPHPHLTLLRAHLDRLDDDRRGKTKEIAALEVEIAHTLVRTPYSLLLALPGINVVGAAELAGEAGPIHCYADSNGLTGRAGLAPSRYQSDRVDRADGPLRRRGNRRLRHALLQAANNLMRHNHYYLAKRQRWPDKPLGWVHVKIAKCFSRLMLAIVSQRCLFPHPACQPRHYILDKLLEFHRDHDTDRRLVLEDLDQVARHFSRRTRQEEINHLQQALEDVHQRRRGPVTLASVIPLVLARLGIPGVQSEPEDLS